MARTKRKGRRTREAKDAAAQRGIDRKRHFADGGSLAEWRGLHKVHDSRPRNRRTRGADNRRAIQESREND